MDDQELNFVTHNHENVECCELTDANVLDLIELIPALKYTNVYIKSRLEQIKSRLKQFK